jgi:hypothetical protein
MSAARPTSLLLAANSAFVIGALKLSQYLIPVCYSPYAFERINALC